jgi:acyl-coenzyme A synthetase/AMP-(fatty) acid ligase
MGENLNPEQIKRKQRFQKIKIKSEFWANETCNHFNGFPVAK